jgi:NlpC/P60 family protein
MKILRNIVASSTLCFCLLTPALGETWTQLENGLGYRAGDKIVLAQEKPQPFGSVVSVAEGFKGIPYVWAGTSPENGFDCSGFVYEVMRINGYTVPRMADHQFEQSKRVKKPQLRLGDMVFFTTYLPGPSHVGIYIGDGEFVHASSAAEGVVVSQLETGYYAERFLGGGRPDGWIGETEVAESGAPSPEMARVEVAKKSGASAKENATYDVDVSEVSVEPSPSDNNKTRDPFSPADLRTVSNESDFEAPILNKSEEAGRKFKLQLGEIAALGKLRVESIVQSFVEILDFNVAEVAKENS